MDRITNFLRKQKKYVGFGLVLLVGLVIAGYLIEIFLDLVEELRQKDLAFLDNSVASFTEQIRNSFLTEFFRTVTLMGDFPFYLIALLIIAVVVYKMKGSWSTTIQTAIILIIAAGINFLLKSFIERQRPDGKHLVSVDSSSFPSGHAISSVAFYGFLIYAIWRSDLQRQKKIISTILLASIILIVGYSRVYLGVHHATDVLAGFAVGGFCLAIFTLAFYTSHFLNHNNH